MQCIFLFRDAQGRLPTAQELRQRGFAVSEAALPAGQGLAVEPLGPYGASADPVAGPGGGPAARPSDRPADKAGA